MGDTPGSYACGIHDFIIKQPDAHITPAFGAGCSSPMFNTDRDAVIQRRNKDVEL
jgi:hypothetical protein